MINFARNNSSRLYAAAWIKPNTERLDKQFSEFLERNLVKALAATGKPIVLILNEGRPRIISDIEPLADAVINVLLPSNYGADALANILIGKVNPSGKMPYTYPRHH